MTEMKTISMAFQLMLLIIHVGGTKSGGAAAELLSILSKGNNHPSLDCLYIEACIKEKTKNHEKLNWSCNKNHCKGQPIPFKKVEVTLTMAYMSKLSYASCYTNIKHALSNCQHDYLPGVGKLNLTAIYEINNPQTGTEGFIAIDNSANIVIVVFTGSQSLIDWLQNVQVTRKSLNNGVFIHSGAYESVNSVYSGIKRVLNSKIRCGKKIYITGHSRGGMLASVLTYLLARDYPHHLSQIKVYTFGSPAVGNKKFANFFKNIESYDVTVIGDIVSYKGCPVYKFLHRFFGYVKSPNVVYLPYQGNHSIKTYINQLKAIQSWGGYTRSYRSNMNHSG